MNSKPANINLQVCFSKSIYHFPCPACGTTRGFIEILRGNIINSLYLNPLSIVFFILFLILPFILIYDLLFKKEFLYKSYSKFELYLKLKKIKILFLILILANWIWNIYKDI
jgi:hypothetical protein